MRLSKHVKFREEKFGGVLFETRTEKVFTLNPVATAVVREIAAGKSAPEIVSSMKERFRGADQEIEKEAADFIAELRAKGLAED